MRGRHGQYPVQSREAVRVLSARFGKIRVYPNLEIDGLDLMLLVVGIGFILFLLAH
jgi:hypothetical protein